MTSRVSVLGSGARMIPGPRASSAITRRTLTRFRRCHTVNPVPRPVAQCTRRTQRSSVGYTKGECFNVINIGNRARKN